MRTRFPVKASSGVVHMGLRRWPYSKPKPLPKLYSGGAPGADSLFGDLALKRGYPQIHFSFDGHDCEYPCKKLSIMELREASPAMLEVRHIINRSIPTNPFVWKLIHRNWFQVKDAEAVIAISEVLPSKKNIKGGTGWACAMGVHRKIPVHVYDQRTGYWYRYNYAKQEYLVDEEPSLSNYTQFAGVGSRDLSDLGARAIRSIMGQLNG